MDTNNIPFCHACGSKSQHLYKDLIDFQFGVQGRWALDVCSNIDCGLIWLNPQPKNLTQLYVNYYTHGKDAVGHRTDLVNVRGGNGTKQEKGWASHLRERFINRCFGYEQSQFSLFDFFLLPFVLLQLVDVRRKARELRYIPSRIGGKILDYGCGSGLFLRKMQDLGWDCFGLDFDPNAVKATKQLGVKAEVLDGENIRIDREAYDVITANHVLEHVSDPSLVLRTLYDGLKIGGELKLFVPNSRSLSHRVWGRSCFHLDPPRHLFHFNRSNLLKIFDALKLDVNIESSSVSAYWSYLNCIITHRRYTSSSLQPQTLRMSDKIKALVFAALETLLCAVGVDCGEQLEISVKKR